MAEVIAKGKELQSWSFEGVLIQNYLILLQLRRQTEREQDDNIRDQLDNQFTALWELIYAPDVLWQ